MNVTNTTCNAKHDTTHLKEQNESRIHGLWDVFFSELEIQWVENSQPTGWMWTVLVKEESIRIVRPAMFPLSIRHQRISRYLRQTKDHRRELVYGELVDRLIRHANLLNVFARCISDS